MHGDDTAIALLAAVLSMILVNVFALFRVLGKQVETGLAVQDRDSRLWVCLLNRGKPPLTYTLGYRICLPGIHARTFVVGR